MSKTLGSVANTEFDSLVKHEFQDMGILRPSVYIKNNIVGDTVKFKKMGQATAKKKTSSSDKYVQADVSHSDVSATLENWYVSEFTDIFDDAEVNFDEKKELATTIAGGLGRRFDQIIIDALDSGTPDASDIAHDSANLTMAKVIDAKVALKGQSVHSGQLHAVIESNGLGGLLNDEKATSSDYQAIQALVKGDINTLMGFNFHVLGDLSNEGGLTESSNIVDSYFYHMDTVGMGIGIDYQTRIDWESLHGAWHCVGIQKMGAVVRDTGGYVKVEYDKTA